MQSFDRLKITANHMDVQRRSIVYFHIQNESFHFHSNLFRLLYQHMGGIDRQVFNLFYEYIPDINCCGTNFSLHISTYIPIPSVPINDILKTD